MIVINGAVEIAAEDVDRFVAISRELCAATREEPGCAAYTFAQSIEVPGRFEIYEEWDDQDALDAHSAAEHYRAWRRGLKTLGVVGMSIVRFEVVDRSVLA